MKNDVARVMRAARTPHGYTLAVWAAGAVCTSAHGQPGFGAVLLFATGATCVFGLISWWVRGDVATSAPESSWAAVHVVAIGAATAAAWVAALLPDPWCWPVCSAAASGVFLLLHSAQDFVL